MCAVVVMIVAAIGVRLRLSPLSLYGHQWSVCESPVLRLSLIAAHEIRWAVWSFDLTSMTSWQKNRIDRANDARWLEASRAQKCRIGTSYRRSRKSYVEADGRFPTRHAVN